VWEKGEIEMGIKQVLPRVLMNWLPADNQARMVADFIACMHRLVSLNSAE
jgi:hypothetical protein